MSRNMDRQATEFAVHAVLSSPEYLNHTEWEAWFVESEAAQRERMKREKNRRE